MLAIAAETSVTSSATIGLTNSYCNVQLSANGIIKSVLAGLKNRGHAWVDRRNVSKILTSPFIER